MKKIFYICTNLIENWDFFCPVNDSHQNSISLLLLHKEQHLENVSISHVWELGKDEQDGESVNFQKNISYQKFLEEIFSHDLSVVI